MWMKWLFLACFVGCEIHYNTCSTTVFSIHNSTETTTVNTTESTTETTTLIAYGPSSLRLNPNYSLITVIEGDQVGPITCKGDCVPDCTYDWSGDGIDENGPTLLISNVNRSIDGYYTCNATNIYGSQTVDLQVVVQYGPDGISLNPAKSTYVVLEGSAFGPISCTSTCLPMCTHIWTGPGIIKLVNQFYLNSIMRNQSGFFNCTASNIVDFYQKGIDVQNVVVQYKPTSLSITPNTEAVTLSEGQQLGPYTCNADCLPTCNFTWKDPMNSGNNLSVLQANVVHITQNGTYTCRATNAHGVSVVTLDVNVQCKPRMDFDTTSSPTVIKLKSGMNLNLTINMIANPGPDIRVDFVNRNSTANVRLYPIGRSNGFKVSASLIIQRINANGFGYYTLSASNALGTFQQVYSVVQEEEPTAPVTIFVSCKSISANIYWKSEFNGGVAQHFYIEYWNAAQLLSKKLTHNISDRGLHADIQHKIANMLSTTTYKFVIVAENSVGISRSNTRNCTTDAVLSAADRKDVLAGGISTLVIGLLISVFGIAFFFYFRMRQQKQNRNAKSENNYTEFQTYMPPKNELYESLCSEKGLGEKVQTFDVDNHTNSELNESSLNKDDTYQNLKSHSTEKREAAYANVLI